MQFQIILMIAFCCACVMADGALNHQPIQPYIFSYTAGRSPGRTDQRHTEVSDGSGVIRGSFSYVDPQNKVRTVQYVADENGFHPKLSHENEDSAAVKRAKQKHFELYNRIAQEHAAQAHHEAAYSQPFVPGVSNSEAVLRETNKHLNLYQKIAAEHAALGAQQKAQRHVYESTSEHSLSQDDDGQYHPERYQ